MLKRKLANKRKSTTANFLYQIKNVTYAFPKNIAIIILRKFTPEQLLKLASVSPEFYQLTQDERLWEELCHLHFGAVAQQTINDSKEEKFRTLFKKLYCDNYEGLKPEQRNCLSLVKEGREKELEQFLKRHKKFDVNFTDMHGYTLLFWANMQEEDTTIKLLEKSETPLLLNGKRFTRWLKKNANELKTISVVCNALIGIPLPRKGWFDREISLSKIRTYQEHGLIWIAYLIIRKHMRAIQTVVEKNLFPENAIEKIKETRELFFDSSLYSLYDGLSVSREIAAAGFFQLYRMLLRQGFFGEIDKAEILQYMMLLAVRIGNIEAFNTLIRQGAKPNGNYIKGASLIHICAFAPGDPVELFEILLENIPDGLTQQSKEGMFPIHFAVLNRNYKVATWIVNKDPNKFANQVQICDSDEEETPLSILTSSSTASKLSSSNSNDEETLKRLLLESTTSTNTRLSDLHPRCNERGPCIMSTITWGIAIFCVAPALIFSLNWRDLSDEIATGIVFGWCAGTAVISASSIVLAVGICSASRETLNNVRSFPKRAARKLCQSMSQCARFIGRSFSNLITRSPTSDTPDLEGGMPLLPEDELSESELDKASHTIEVRIEKGNEEVDNGKEEIETNIHSSQYNAPVDFGFISRGERPTTQEYQQIECSDEANILLNAV